MSHKISTRVLRAMGFTPDAEIPGLFTLVLASGWSIEYAHDMGLEIAHGGHAVPMRCRGKEHLELLIKTL